VTIRSKLHVAGAMGRIGTGLVTERLTGSGSPARHDGVPKSADHLTKKWLTAVLCHDVGGAEVIDVQLANDSSGSTAHRSVALSYNHAGAAADLPTRLFTKSTPTFHTRLLNGLSGALFCEAAFYQKVRPRIAIESPVGYHLAIDRRFFRSMFLLEDVEATRGARFGDPTTLKVTESMARTQLELLATLHAEFWDSARLTDELRMLRTTYKWMTDANQAIDFEGRSVGAGVDRASGVLPDELLAHRYQLWNAYMRSLQINVSGPLTLQHQDLHLGNWYVTQDERMGLFDWQCMAVGGWAKDVAYAIAAALSVEDRRAWERDLVAYYVEILRQHGVTSLDFDQAWLSYRQQTFHALFFWLYTIGYGPLQPKMQPDNVCLENIERMARAVVDLDSLAALES
jgi:Phosphotransferase enzyme family